MHEPIPLMSSTDDVKSKLFQAYCSNVYCSQLWWNYNSEAYKKFVVAYNNCFRRLLGYKLTCSASQMFLCYNVHHFSVSRRKSMYSFMSRIKSGDNLVIQNVYMWESTFYKEWCDILCKMNLHCLFLLLSFFIVM